MKKSTFSFLRFQSAKVEIGTPFLFTVETLRQVSENDANFEYHFALALDYYYQLKAMGQNVPLDKVIKEYIINPKNNGKAAPIKLTQKTSGMASNQHFKDALRSLMKQATDQYSQCVKTYGLQVSVGNAPVAIPNDQACSCLGEFSVEDALNNFDFSWEMHLLFANTQYIFDQKIDDENIGPALTGFLPRRRVCPLSITFVNSNELPNELLTGISGLQFAIRDANGAIVNYTLPPLYISMPVIPPASGKTQQQALADAINNTVFQIQININNGVSPPITQYANPPRPLKPNEWFLQIFNNQLKQEYQGTTLGTQYSGPGATVVDPKKNSPPSPGVWGTGTVGLFLTFGVQFLPINSTCL